MSLTQIREQTWERGWRDAVMWTLQVILSEAAEA